MDIAKQYAHALYEAHKGGARGLAARARKALVARGHGKLMPKIAQELEKLELEDARRRAHARVTPEGERTRVLLELYKKLIAS